MQEAVIHFVSHNVMRSYSDAISSRACSQRIILALQKWRRTFESMAASILKPISATYVHSDVCTAWIEVLCVGCCDEMG
ncbi:hypothetical protein CEXT_110871 [Caerostris extrusa]|uniref:Uncharacterized protein n=1 Tax=Caerostris extrusa TaxID=172846 RepID=A0AAV4W7N0_CAEEX|nr:hypothetical protein CEXT_110871 [Caerostris extrusa]